MHNSLSRREFLRRAGIGAAAMALPSMGQGAEMTHRERIEAVIAGKETDRLPFSFWWHFANQDRNPRRLAELCLALQKEMGLDFIKFAPYGLYSVVDWGTILNVRGGDRTPVVAEYGIKQPDDWRKLKVIEPTEGEYAVLLAAQRIAIRERRDDTPLVQTVFNPLTSAAKLAGAGMLLEHIREHPDAVQAGLEVITETTRKLAIEIMKQGADGLFYATQWTDRGRLTVDEFRAFSKSHDLHILDAIKGDAWFSMLHFHRDAMWDEVLDYPVQAFNFPDYGDNALSIDEARKITDKVLITGLPSGLRGGGLLEVGTPADAQALVDNAWKGGTRRGVILAPDEVVNHNAKAENLAQLVEGVAATEG